MDDDRRDGLAKEFIGFLPREDRARHRTYWAICRGVANDPELLELADLVPPPQLRVNVFLASVHHLLLEGTDHELAHLYPSVCVRLGIARRTASDDVVATAFGAFCRLHAGAIAQRCSSRATQTNEVGRCAVLRAALGAIAHRGDAAVGLLDVGCSAGLNLFVDAYRCDYSGCSVGPRESTVTLDCELRGAAPHLELPVIASRTGLDLSPVDATDDDAVAWLLACLWPDDLGRFERLDAAVAIARDRRDEVVLVQGDMVGALGAAASRVAPECRLVVVNMWSAAYLAAERRRALFDAVAGLAASRPLTWVTMEHPVIARDLGVLGDDVALDRNVASVVCATEFEGRGAHSVVLATTHPHGAWLDWRGTSLA